MLNITLNRSPGFCFPRPSAKATAAAPSQTSTVSSATITNGYGVASTVTVSPGYGATMHVVVDMTFDSVTQNAIDSVVTTAKQSSQYSTNSAYKALVDNTNSSNWGSSSSGIFGWLTGNSGSGYSNQSNQSLTNVGSSSAGQQTADQSLATTMANTMLSSVQKVQIAATIDVTGTLLTPSPTQIVVETTTFSFTDQNGNTQSVSLTDSTPVGYNPTTGAVSPNTTAGKLNIVPVASTR